MTMAENDTELDRLFAAARQNRDHLPDDLAIHMMTDAEAVRMERLKPKSAPAQRLRRRILDAIGGWQGLGGLVAASAAGVWIGFAAPGFLPDPANLWMPQDTVFVIADITLDEVYSEDGQ